MKRTALIAVFEITLIGCASAPERKPPDVRVEMPAAWTSAAADTTWTADARWWRQFESSSLDSIVDEALRHNYDIQVAVARVDAAAAVARLAGAELYPHVSAAFDASRRQQNILGFPIPGQAEVIQTRSTALGASLDVTWEVDLWGRVRMAKSAALADVEATWADLAALRLSIASQTAKAYFAMIEARLQVELAEATVESFRLSAEQVRRRYEQGVRPALDLRLALANLASAQALLEARREQLDRTTRGLELLLGRYPSAALRAAGELPAVAAPVPAGLPSDLLIRRPDLLAAERRFAAGEKRVSDARRAFFPSLALTGSAGTLSTELENLVDGDFGVWNIAARLTQPIFQAGRLRANLAQSEAIADQILADYGLSLLRAFGEVESSLFAEDVLERRVAHTAVAAEQSEAARLLAERQYEAGLIDYITVLETQRRALATQSELLAVRRQRLDARVNLHLALGGGFDFRSEWTAYLEAHNDTEDSGE